MKYAQFKKRMTMYMKTQNDYDTNDDDNDSYRYE